MDTRQLKIIIIVGPTASGKSDLSLWLAKKINGEIVSADSRQVYRGMDIGTGKVTKAEQKVAPHHLLDVADPKRVFSVAQFQKKCFKAIQDINGRSHVPLIVGGTGFYIDSIAYNFQLPPVKANPQLRAKLEKQSAEQLFNQLKKLDPVRASTIDSKNKRRLIRSLEIINSTGQPIPFLPKNPRYQTLWLGITWPKPKLDKRIKIRLDSRLKLDMIAEVKKLHKNGISYKRLESFGLEYRWIAQYLQNKITLEEMKNGLYSAIVHYAKRQMTWFKRNQQINWVTNRTQAMKLTREFLSS